MEARHMPRTFPRPYEESNLDFSLRRAALYPLSYRDRERCGVRTELWAQNDEFAELDSDLDEDVFIERSD